METNYDMNEVLQHYLLKRRRLEIDHDQCTVCNTPFNLTLHHIEPRRKGGLDTLANTIIKCRECHDSFHVEEITLLRMRKRRLQEIKASLSYEDMHPELDMEAVLLFFAWIRLVCEQNLQEARRHPYARHVHNWA